MFFVNIIVADQLLTFVLVLFFTRMLYWIKVFLLLVQLLDGVSFIKSLLVDVTLLTILGGFFVVLLFEVDVVESLDRVGKTVPEETGVDRRRER